MGLVPTRRAFELAISVPGYSEIEECSGAQAPRLFTERWRYRSASSAGSRKGLTAGIESRLHTAARFAFPVHQAQTAIAKLLTIAAITGVEPVEMRRLVRKHAKRYPHIYSQWLERAARNAFKLQTAECIQQLRHAVGRARSSL